MSNGEEECQRILKLTNYYEILGIEKTATEEQIKKAYRKLAIKFHPDKNKAKSAEEAFKKVNQAFCCLSDKTKRQNYDMFGSENGIGGIPSSGGADIDPFEIFNMFFGQGNPFGPMGGGFNNSGRTTFKFGNNGGFTVYSTSFGGDGDDIFSNLFGFPGMREVHRSRSTDNFRRDFNSQRSGKRQGTRENNNMQRSMDRLNWIIQLLPLICCLIVFFFPTLINLFIG